MTVKVFQIKDIENCSYAFRSYNKALFNYNDYQCVCVFTRTGFKQEGAPRDLLEFLFTESNLGRLIFKEGDVTGHSLSVSDVVAISEDEDSSSKYYYCNPFGWKEITVKKEGE